MWSRSECGVDQNVGRSECAIGQSVRWVRVWSKSECGRSESVRGWSWCGVGQNVE